MTKKSEATKEVAEVEVDQERIDRVIWRGIGVKSVRLIAEEAGIKPEEVLRRKNELLEEVDVLTINEKRSRILAELDEMARSARERSARASDEFAAGLLNASASAMKTVLAELARSEKQDAGKIEALNQLRIKELLRLVDTTVSRTFREISSVHEVPEEEMMNVFQGLLSESARDLDVSS